jgi:hypothetical protein
MAKVPGDQEKVRASLCPKTPVTHCGEDLDLKRLSRAYPIIRPQKETSFSNDSWEAEERHKQFNWWFNRETRQMSEKDGLEDRRATKALVVNKLNPLLLADDYLPMATVEDRKLDEDRAKAKMLSTVPEVRPIKKSVIKHLGYLLMMGGIVLSIGYFYSKMR